MEAIQEEGCHISFKIHTVTHWVLQLKPYIFIISLLIIPYWFVLRQQGYSNDLDGKEYDNYWKNIPQ